MPVFLRHPKIHNRNGCYSPGSVTKESFFKTAESQVAFVPSFQIMHLISRFQICFEREDASPKMALHP